MSTIERPTPDVGPVEGRDDLDLPGADRGSDVPDPPEAGHRGGGSPETERRDELADRVRHGGPGAAGSIDSDLRPDIEVPDEQM